MAEVVDFGKIGSYHVEGSRYITGEHDIAILICTSNISPVQLSIDYGDRNQTSSSDPANGENYGLIWPTELAGEGVVEIIRAKAKLLPDPEFICITPSDEAEPKITDNLDDVLRQGFNFLRVLSPSGEGSLAWQAIEDDQPQFFMIGTDSDLFAEPFIRDTIEKTIPARYLGSVAVALETLNVILNMYAEPPAELIS